jgi:hypothetical protein
VVPGAGGPPVNPFATCNSTARSGEEEHDGGAPRVAGEPDDDEEPDADDEGAL